MKFKNLQTSIELNKNSPPSIMTALYMTESLFDDIRESAEKRSLAECDMGDEEMLPVKMVWLCSQIAEIYRETAGKYEPDDELDRAAVELQKVRSEMQEYADIAKKLAELTREKEDLQKELENAKRLQNDCDFIRSETDHLKAEIAELSLFDMSEAGACLAELKTRKEELSSRKCRLENELTVLQTDIDRLNGEITAVTDSKTEAAEKLQCLENEKEKLTDETNSLITSIGETAAALDALSTKKEAMLIQQGELTETQTVLQNEIDAYYTANILPLTDEIEKLKADIAENETALEALRHEEKEKNTRFSELVMGIGQFTASLSALAGKINTKQTLFDTKQQEANQKQLELDGLEKNYNELIQQLGDAQDHIERLETEELPRLRNEYSAAGEAESVLLAQKDELEKKISAIETELPQKEAVCAERKNCYEMLTSKFNKTDADITELNRQIEELTKLTDEERVGQLRIQHTEKINKLEALQKEEGMLEQQNNELDRKLVEEERNRQELENTQKRYNDTIAAISESKKALAQFDSPQIRAQIEANSARLNQLENVRKKMVTDIQMMAGVLGTAPVSYDPNGLSSLMNNCRLRLNDISQALINCAGSLHLEERS